MENENEQSLARMNNVFLMLAIMVVMYLAGNWLATQKTAADTGYNPVLGGFQIGSVRVYQPFAIRSWRKDADISTAIPHILRRNQRYVWGFIIAGAAVCFLIAKRSGGEKTSHGTARFADKTDFDEIFPAKENGVVIGANPYTGVMLLDDGPQHVLLVAPTGSGKGVSLIIPTCIVWKHSLFVFDPKAENWSKTGRWRKLHHKQQVMKFEPLCVDGSSARWNPFAEINFQTNEEITDVKTIAQTMAVSGGDAKGKDPFWDNSAITLVSGIILHLLYSYWREKRGLPCPSDVMSFMSSEQDTDHQYAGMMIHPHISPEDFLESAYAETETQPDGTEKIVEKKRRNPLKEVYGDYIRDFSPFAERLPDFGERLKMYRDGRIPSEELDKSAPVLGILRECILQAIENGEVINWDAPPIGLAKDKKEIQASLNMYPEPWYKLLVHPTVIEGASMIFKGADQTRASIIQSAQAAMGLYQDPLVRQNTAVSDFALRDLLDPSREVSLFYVVQPNDIDKVKLLTRLFVNAMLSKLVRDMKYDTPTGKQQRLLMLFDEFPQLGKLADIENTLAICRSYGIKICIVAQDLNQIYQIYTKENGIMGNTQTQVYYTPTNFDSAKAISDRLGDRTITTHNISHNGKLFESNVSDSETGRKLMKPEEIQTMPGDKEIVFASGFTPVLAGKIRWWKDPFFQRRVYDPPKNNLAPLPFSDTCTPIQNFDQLFAIHAAEGIETAEKIRFVKEARALAEQKALPTEEETAADSNTAEDVTESQATVAEAQPDSPMTTDNQEMEETTNENCVGESSEVESDDERESEDFVGEDDGADSVEGDGDGGQQSLENEKPESTVEASPEIKEAALAAEATEDMPTKSTTDGVTPKPDNGAFAAWKQKAMKKMAEKGAKKAGA